MKKRINRLGIQTGMLMLALAGAYSASAQWVGMDVGAPGVPGSITNNPDGSYTMMAGGGDIWNTADQMYYYYQPVPGSSIWWDAVVKVTRLDCASSTWAKTEMMVRQDGGTGAPTGPDAFIGAMTTSAGSGCQDQMAWQWRPSPAGSSANWIDPYGTHVQPQYPNAWCRVGRVGSVFSTYFSTDGTNWNLYGAIDTSTKGPDGNFDGIAWSNVFIGVACTAHNNATLTETIFSNLSLTIHTVVNPSVLGVQTQVHNATNYAYGEASFTFVATNNAQPQGVFDNAYTWYKNGQVVSNVTGQSYTYLASAANNGDKVYCNVTTPGFPALSLNSATGTVTVLPATYYTNGVKVERFLGAFLADVEDGNTGPASGIRVSTEDGSASPLDYTGFENLPNDGINNYAERLTGWFIPPASGNYVFFVASDDQSDVFISTDNTPLNKQLICQETAWSNPREWSAQGTTNLTDSGGALYSQKRSDQWTNDLGVAPFTNGIALTAGTQYYIEADHYQGGGGENVGVLAQLLGASDPTNGAPPIPASQLVLASYPAIKISWLSNSVPQTVFEGGSPLYYGVATSDSEFVPLYQWQYNGTNLPGATTSAYTFTSIAANNGAIISLIASTAEGGLSITNSSTLVVQKAAFENGLALMQYWENQTAASPEGTPPLGPPVFTMAVPAFEAGVNNENGDNYVNEVSGYFIPAVSGTYDFICTGDDNVDLFLSTDNNPNNKRLICQEPNWSNALTWGTDSAGVAGDLQQRQSWTWTNANSGGVAPFANGFTLTAGTQYYIEMWHHEGGGGDSCAATFTMRTGGVVAPSPADGTDSAITGSLLGFKTPAASYMAYTQQPSNTTVLSGTTATFTADGTSDGKIPIGTTGEFCNCNGVTAAPPSDFLPFPTVLFQWYKNGVLIPGATSSSYTTPLLLPTDTGAQYYTQIRALGYPTWSNSMTASVTVTKDTTQPSIIAVGSFTENTLPVVSVSFSKRMDLASLSAMGNYTIAGVQIVGIVVNSNDATHVTLQLAAAPTTFPVQLTVTGITDFSGNALVSSTATVNNIALANLDIGDPQANPPDPAFPGYLWAEGTNSFTIMCEGSDIYNAADGFNYSYESKTGDFDVVVRQKTFTKTSNYAKGGLMVREDTTAGSRDWNIVNDPTSADGIPALAGDGNGANQTECNCRPNATAASVGWATGPQTVPAFPNAWLRLKRVGQILTAYWSSNAVDWVEQATTDWSTTNSTLTPVPATMLVGICCTSHQNDSASAVVPTFYYTATFADYNSSYVAPTNTPRAKLTASVSGSNLILSWTPAGGTLQSSPTLGVGAPWAAVTPAPGNPATIPLSPGAKFYRVGP